MYLYFEYIKVLYTSYLEIAAQPQYHPLSPTMMMEDIITKIINPHLGLFVMMYLMVYLSAFFILFRGWARELRPEASSCSISLAHGTPAVFLASYALVSDPGVHFESRNTALQNLVLEYSIAYFLTDLLHLLLFSPADILYIGHHLCTLFVFLTCRYVANHGAFAILVLLILAEVTSFCQNLWTLAGARRSDLKFAATVYHLLSPPFYGFYTVVRGFLAPYFVYRMILVTPDGGVIPHWVWISWLCVVVVAISVSILWISNLWVDLYKERIRKQSVKKKVI